MASGRSLLLLIITVLLLLLVIDRGGPSHTSVSSATTPGPFDLDEEEGLRAAVDAVGSELVLLTTNAGGLTSAVNMALQLRRVGLTAVLVLADRRSTCTTAHASWPWLRCGWSMGLGTFERYRAAPMVSREERLLWALWSAKWLTCARLVDLRVTVLALDSDAFVLTNPFALLNAPPLSHYAMVVPAEGARVNIGFLYVRGASVSPGGGASSVLWDVVRRLRIFTGALLTTATLTVATVTRAALTRVALTRAASLRPHLLWQRRRRCWRRALAPTEASHGCSGCGTRGYSQTPSRPQHRASMSTRTRTPSPPPTPYGLAWGGPPLRHISPRPTPLGCTVCCGGLVTVTIASHSPRGDGTRTVHAACRLLLAIRSGAAGTEARRYTGRSCIRCLHSPV